MNKGWVVVRFSRDKPTKNVEWFSEQFEAQEEAERLNEEIKLIFDNPNTWYGWERDK